MQQHGSSAQGRGAAAAFVRPPVRLKIAGSSRLPSAPLRSASLLGAICLLLLACEDGASSGAGRSSSALTSNDGSTGVTECDSYLDQYELCMQATLPSHQFTQQQNGIRRQRTAWKTMADSLFKKQALAHVCRQAITTARQEFQTCTWTGGL
ncbi:hypothetical protein BE04_07050 [Sorangium cellulosum]|uniref:Uncharacterized protein n=2 Tax=Sorangium cellulosum TaxID=56 RepID=A0A150PGB7_SORCE|nr:hypothetical protein [Sorangium cellulosum]AGP40170.1 hypothetical protein SCE1572_40115 [Sorangium cellulosum So0157-2]KYF54715.1 hypothetical protein BE04_07050 [Sorangium cellulosum]